MCRVIMCDLPSSNKNNYHWSEETSKKGVPFLVGTVGAILPESSSNPEEGSGGSESQPNPAPIAVNWPVGDQTWKETSPEVQEKKDITDTDMLNTPTHLPINTYWS
ncbi:hypothetical protein GYMLUDRAFT_55501 [Collybiopsis luxurians FD-317 M1]|nr:hypothetical protein GYMLUDRAFT_55501 [Collybiopsis luxurians FD-317 M1]